MSLLASHRTLAAASSLLLAAIGLTGCLKPARRRRRIEVLGHRLDEEHSRRH